MTNSSFTGLGLGTDVLSNFESAFLTGGNSFNTLDASGFTGDVTLVGGGGGDQLRGGSGNDSLTGGEGNDVLTGGAGGQDTLDAGGGTDRSTGGETNVSCES